MSLPERTVELLKRMVWDMIKVGAWCDLTTSQEEKENTFLDNLNWWTNALSRTDVKYNTYIGGYINRLQQECHWTVDEILELAHICRCTVYYKYQTLSWYVTYPDHDWISYYIRLPFTEKENYDRCMQELQCRFALRDVQHHLPEELIQHIISFT